MRDIGYVSGIRYPQPEEAVAAWVNFNGTGVVAIFSSLNVSSITDNGTGDWTVNWLFPFSSVNYAVSCIGRYDPGTAAGAASMKLGTTPALGSIRIAGSDGATDGAQDLRHVCVSAYGRGPWPQRPGVEQIVTTWGNWDVTGALQDSENLSSITDNGTGDWTMNMRIPYASEALYAVGATTQGNSICWMAIKQLTAMAAGSINFTTGNATGAPTDPTKATAMLWGYF